MWYGMRQSKARELKGKSLGRWKLKNGLEKSNTLK